VVPAGAVASGDRAGREPGAGATAPDGSPVEVFRRLPPGPAPGLVHAALPDAAEILELGCGAGRLTRALVELGHRVVAVDVSAAMLACLAGVAGVETIEADIVGLDLGRAFGGVVLASYLVNHPDAATAAALLATCRRHVAAGGTVAVQRYDPVWASEGVADEVRVGEVTLAVGGFTPTAGGRVGTVVTYTVGGRSWAQRVEARILTDADVGRLAAEARLAVAGWLDAYRTWARLVPR